MEAPIVNANRPSMPAESPTERPNRSWPGLPVLVGAAAICISGIVLVVQHANASVWTGAALLALGSVGLGRSHARHARAGTGHPALRRLPGHGQDHWPALGKPICAAPERFGSRAQQGDAHGQGQRRRRQPDRDRRRGGLASSRQRPGHLRRRRLHRLCQYSERGRPPPHCQQSPLRQQRQLRPIATRPYGRRCPTAGRRDRRSCRPCRGRHSRGHGSRGSRTPRRSLRSCCSASKPTRS